MRQKAHWFGCLLGAVLLLAGCQGTEEPLTTVEGQDWREETPVWSMVSTAPEDFGITYDDLTDLDGYPLDKLAAYCLGADGVFAEDGFDQLYCRFVEAPRTWVTYVSLLPEEEQKILCEHTALAAASWYADSNEFSENLDVLEKAYSSGAEEVVISMLRSEYENAAV